MSMTDLFLNADECWTIDKKLASLIGIKEALFLAELTSVWDASQVDRATPVYVSHTQSTIEAATGMSRATQTRFLKKLAALQFISIKREGTSYNRNLYMINKTTIDQYMREEG